MRFYSLSIFLLASSLLAFAQDPTFWGLNRASGGGGGTTRYIAQTAGTFSGGTACNGQTAITPATWDATAESPGDIGWICGTLTGTSATLLTFPSAGTSGNVITLKFDTGASITYPAIPVAGAIVDNKNYTLIDGNNLAGTVTSTTNGDCAGCSTTTQSVGINLTCTHCEVRNLNVGPIFQRSSSDTSSNGNATQGIAVNAGSDSIKIDGNNVSNAFELIYVAYGSTMASLSINGNTTDYSSHHITVGDSNSSHTLTGCNIYGNTVGSHFNVWQDTAQTMHADGIFVFAGNTGSSATCNVYNNSISGDMCTTSGLNCSAYIYLDGNNNSYVFNNAIQHLSNTGTGPEGGIIVRGTANQFAGIEVINNTYIGGPNAIQFKNGGGTYDGTGLVLENNIWSTGQYFYGFGPNTFASLNLSNYNVFYSAGTAVAAKNVDASPTFYTTLANWQAADSQDAASSAGNPLLTSFVPQSGSSAIGLAANLYSTCNGQANPGLGALCFDIAGNTRPTSGNWDAGAYIYVAGGAPLTYNARTDNCVTGAESGCIGGATTGEAGSPLSFLIRNTDATPFPDITTGSANAGAMGTDPDFGTTLVMATDESTGSTCFGSAHPWTISYSLGDSGNLRFASQDGKMLLVGTQNATHCVLLVNPASIHNKTCSTIPCVTATSISDVNFFSNNGTTQGFQYSQVAGETNVIYSLVQPALTAIVEVDKNIVCPDATWPNCSGQSSYPAVIETAYADMRNVNTSVCGSDLTKSGSGGATTAFSGPTSGAWSSNFTVASDGSAAWGTGGAVDYNATAWTPLAGQTFILPTVNNAAKNAFYASAVTGPTSGTEPNWTSSCNTKGNTCPVDGGVTWVNIGPIGGQGPGFTMFLYKPGHGCTMINTRSEYEYRSSSSPDPAGHAVTADGIECTKTNGAPCTGSTTVNLPDGFGLHDLGLSALGDQLIAAPTGGSGANAPGNWNSGTLSGQLSNAVWTGQTTGSSPVNINNGVWSSAGTYAAHQVVVYQNYFFTALTSSTNQAPPTPNPAVPTSNTYWQETEGYPLDLYYSTTSLKVAPCTDFLNCNGHQGTGTIGKVYAGRYSYVLFSNPVINGLFNPGTKELPQALASDFHGSWNQITAMPDTAPIGILGTSIPAWPTEYTAALYAEIAGVVPGGSGPTYRFAHPFNTGSNPGFSPQNNIGQISNLGDLMYFPTDMMGKRGSASATNTICPPSSYAIGSAASYPPRGQYQPSTGNTVNYEDTMMVLSTNYIYQAVGFWNGTSYITTGTGTEGGTLPGWASACGAAGNYCTVDGTTATAPLDGNVLWLNDGQNGCRADIMIADPVSSHAAP